MMAMDIQSKQLPVIVWNDERVITTAQLAEVYGASEKQVQQNYNNHKCNFIEKKHYFFLKGPELQSFKNYLDNIEVVPKRAPSLYLWTRRGASRHCKILDTERAWEQFDYLEEAYFNPAPRVPVNPMSGLSPQLQLLINMEIKQKEQDGQIASLRETTERQEQALKTIKDTLTNAEGDFRRWVIRSINEIAKSPSFAGTWQKYQKIWLETYDRLNDKYPCDLDRMIKDERARAEAEGKSKTFIKNINRQYIIAAVPFLREAYRSVIQDMLIAYCVDV